MAGNSTKGPDPLQGQLVSALSAAYEIGDRIGAGAMGAVFEARDRRHNRRVAIKVIREEVATSMTAARFLREIRIAANLHHPHILQLYDSGEAGGMLYYVSPLVVGESLRARLVREKQLPVLEVCHIVLQVAGALAFAHRAGIVHRDIKPDNILLSEGEAYVADFGIAKATQTGDVDPTATSPGVSVGTPLYMSPELAAGDTEVDGRSDQYALACVAFEMLAGEPPFNGSSSRMILARQVTQPPPSIRQLRPGLSADAERVLHRALAKAPDDRYANTTEFARALDQALAGSRTMSPEASSRPNGSVHAGRLVAKTCNRWAQVNAFDSFLRTARRATPGRPQMYLMHGEEGDAHDSLLDRLVHTTLSRFAEEIGGLERGEIVRIRAPWSDADDLESARRDLGIALFREADPAYLGDDLTPMALASTLARRPQKVVVIHHDIRAKHLHRFTPELVEWYANEFWGALDIKATDQQFIVFLKVIYPSRQAPRMLRALGLAADPRRTLRSIHERLSRPDNRCASMVFRELQPLTLDDVHEWFSNNGIYESDQKRQELAEALFRERSHRRMADVEVALEEIHRTFLNEQQFELGSNG